MTEIMETLSVLSLLVFVIGSMANMGLSLKVNQIIAPPSYIKLDSNKCSNPIVESTAR